MKAKQLAWIQLIGGLVALWYGWQGARWDSLALALVVLIMAWHHFQGK